MGVWFLQLICICLLCCYDVVSARLDNLFSSSNTIKYPEFCLLLYREKQRKCRGCPRNFSTICSESLLNFIVFEASASPAPWKSSEEFFSLQIKDRDPLKKGFVFMSVLCTPN
ncbi:hypothetical protein P3L10_002387 [Capsicum annuum]